MLIQFYIGSVSPNFSLHPFCQVLYLLSHSPSPATIFFDLCLKSEILQDSNIFKTLISFLLYVYVTWVHVRGHSQNTSKR